MRTVLLWILAAGVAAAQEMEVPKPAPELARYERLLGTWEGSGTVATGTDASSTTQWTSVSHVRRVLNGHFVRSDTRIEVQGEMPGTLAFITVYGWDGEKERHVAYEISNMGTIQESEVTWLDADTMVSVSATSWMGAPKVERWITRIAEGSHQFVGEEATGEGDWHVHVRGTSKRSATAKPVAVEDLPPVFVDPTPPMADVLKMAGTYAVQGSFQMTPDAPAMEFSGREVAKPIFGGGIVQFVASGQPGDWEGWHAMGYDATRKCFRSLSVDNMGMMGASDAWRLGDDWVFTSAGTLQHTPVVYRMVLSTDAKGHLTKASAYAIHGTGAPYRQFQATYRTATGEAGTTPASTGGEKD